MLRKKLVADMTASLKSGDSTKLAVLRYIVAQIKDQEIEKKKELNDEETTLILQRNAKNLRESIAAFEKGNRTDLASDSKKQLEIITGYLPKQISTEELTATIKELIAKNQTVFDSNPKAMIGICMRELKNKADSARIISILNSLTK